MNKRMNKRKPQICIIDENVHVHKAWQSSLGVKSELCCYHNPQEAISGASPSSLGPEPASGSYYCLIVARHFRGLGIDMLRHLELAANLKSHFACPLFLNWLGSVPRGEIKGYFDGIIQEPYGMEWHSLRLKVQACLRTPESASTMRFKHSTVEARQCQHLLKTMAARASAPHKHLFEAYAQPRNFAQAKALLEAFYNHLVTSQQPPTHLPTHLIHTSPRIAARILHAILFANRSASDIP